MTDPQRTRSDWVDLGGAQRLADRAARTTRTPPEEFWLDRVRPVLHRHWPLADFAWHRRRTWEADGAEQAETDHQLTRCALLPDGRLVRATTWGSESTAGAGTPWTGEVRPLGRREARSLDLAVREFSLRRGTTTTWGTRPEGEPVRPWPGAGLEALLKALVP